MQKVNTQKIGWLNDIIDIYLETIPTAMNGFKSETTDFSHEFGTEKGAFNFYESPKIEKIELTCADFPVRDVDPDELIKDKRQLMLHIQEVLKDNVYVKGLELKVFFTHKADDILILSAEWSD